MSWKFVPSDDFDLDQLNKWKQFLEKDLKAAKDWLREVQNFIRRMRLPDDKGWAVKLATDDVKISKDNLAKVNEAIKIAEGRAPRWETKWKNEPSDEEKKEIKKRDKKYRWF